ncbi:MAG: hypothetical protein KC620_18330, partial [Myxococcales bacterium]|nr:hypothetical protein [Myxococcales bacterium]
MRFVLRKGGQSFLVFSRDRFLELDTLERAVDFLTDYLLSPDNLRALRRAILDDAVRIHLLGLDLSELIEHVGRLMFDGELRFLLNPRDMTPWRWAFPHTPSFPSEQSEGKAEAKSLTGEADKGEDKEPEYEDIKPEPVVPPEFPRMAKRESDAIDL